MVLWPVLRPHQSLTDLIIKGASTQPPFVTAQLCSLQNPPAFFKYFAQHLLVTVREFTSKKLHLCTQVFGKCEHRSLHKQNCAHISGRCFIKISLIIFCYIKHQNTSTKSEKLLLNNIYSFPLKVVYNMWMQFIFPYSCTYAIQKILFRLLIKAEVS